MRMCDGIQPASHVQLGDAAVVALEDRHEILGEVVLVLAGQLADDAEVQRDEARIVLARRRRPRCCRRAHRRGRNCRGTPACRTRARPWRRAPGGRCRPHPAPRCRPSGMPCTRSRVSARLGGVAARCTSGTYRSSRVEPAAGASRWRWRPRAAGRARRTACFRSPATISRGRILSAVGWWRSTSAASVRSRAMSAVDLLRDARAQHLDHHLAAVVQRARACTCAIDAEASGVVSNAGEQLRRPACPARARSRARASSPSNGATRSCSSVSSSAMSGGTRSRRVDRIWPNLTKIGPSSCKRQAQARAARQNRLRRASAGMNGRSSLSHAERRWSSSKSSRRCEQHAADAQGADGAAHAAGATHSCAACHRAPAGARCARPGARRVAQGVDVVVEGVKLGLGDHVATFLGDVFGRVPGQVAWPARCRRSGPRAGRARPAGRSPDPAHRRTACPSPDRILAPVAAACARGRHRR